MATAKLPAARPETDAQVKILRALGTAVTDDKITHEQAVAQLRREISRELAAAPRAAAEA